MNHTGEVSVPYSQEPCRASQSRTRTHRRSPIVRIPQFTKFMVINTSFYCSSKVYSPHWCLWQWLGGGGCASWCHACNLTATGGGCWLNPKSFYTYLIPMQWSCRPCPLPCFLQRMTATYTCTVFSTQDDRVTDISFCHSLYSYTDTVCVVVYT